MHVFTGVQTQGRYDRGRRQEYVKEYTLEYWRPDFKKWREYMPWNGNQVIPKYIDERIKLGVAVKSHTTSDSLALLLLSPVTVRK